jgi:hypothetical protein
MDLEFVETGEKVFLFADADPFLFVVSIEMSSFSKERRQICVHDQRPSAYLRIGQLMDVGEITLMLQLFGAERMLDSIDEFSTFHVLDAIESSDANYVHIDRTHRSLTAISAFLLR